MVFSQLMLTLVVKLQIKTLVKSKQAGNSLQIFPKPKTFVKETDF
jgi:hypothetical protein